MTEEWIPLGDALARVDEYERQATAIIGLEFARITSTEKIHLPAVADFADSDADQSWSFARELLAERVPPEATHVTFMP